MIGAEERRRLIEAYLQTGNVWIVLGRAAAGLLAIALISAISPALYDAQPSNVAGVSAKPAGTGR